MREGLFTPNQMPWIEAGYRVFAFSGPSALRVEELAREVGISKSSFYHHFADMEVYVSFLLRFHRERAKAIAAEAAKCQEFDPGFIELLLHFREDIFFNRMLRVHQDNLDFQVCYQTSHLMVERAILPIWSKWLGGHATDDYARSLFTVISDVFYQRLSTERYTYDWIADLLSQIRSLIHDIGARNEWMLQSG